MAVVAVLIPFTPTSSQSRFSSAILQMLGLGAYAREIYTSPKLPKFDLATDAEYVASLVNVNTWFTGCKRKKSAVYYMGMLCTCITTFFLLISQPILTG